MPASYPHTAIAAATREARRFPRYRTDLPLIVKLLGDEGYLRIHGRCTEIAESGLGAVVTAELTPGEMVTLELSLPTARDLSLRAVVRHRMGFLHGFEYVNTSLEVKQSILDFCHNLPLIP